MGGGGARGGVNSSRIFTTSGVPRPPGERFGALPSLSMGGGDEGSEIAEISAKNCWWSGSWWFSKKIGLSADDIA